MIAGAVYSISNLLNGKVYIGSAVDYDSRWRTHKSRLNRNIHSNKHLQGAWNEYGEVVFNFVVLEYVFDKLNLLKREQYWIDTTECCDPKLGYNKRKIANSNLGLKLGPASDERKLKLKLAHTGRIISEEQREKIRNTLSGRKLTAQHIANVAAAIYR